MKYRKLIDEPVQVGDVASSSGVPEDSDVFANPGERCIGRNSNIPGWDNDFWYRKVASDNWIAFSDRAPTRSDADNSGSILAHYDDGRVMFRPWNFAINASWWMPLNFIPREPARVKVDGHEVIPNRDGSLKVGCRTIPSRDFEEIARQRQGVMK